MRIRFIALAAALLFGLGACAGTMSPGGSMSSAYPSGSGSGNASGMGGHGGGGY